MPHHFPKNTEQATAWCNTCKALTLHLVSAGRIGRCVNEHHQDKGKREDKPVSQGQLFSK